MIVYSAGFFARKTNGQLSKEYEVKLSFYICDADFMYWNATPS